MDTDKYIEAEQLKQQVQQLQAEIVMLKSELNMMKDSLSAWIGYAERLENGTGLE